MNKVRLVSWLAIAVCAGAVLYLAFGTSSSGYVVKAEFKDVDNLRQGSTVKVAGVPAGKVSSLVVTPQGYALATLSLDKSVGPIGAGASVQVRPTDLLGEHYAQLTVGNLSKPQPSGTLIPFSRTSVPVELDQVLDTLNTPVRERLRILIEEAGVALDGRGADFNQLLTELPGNLSQAEAMLSQVSTQDATLEHLIDEGDQVTTAIDAKRVTMGKLITAGEEAFHSVALKQAQLSSTINDAPSTLSQLQSTLTELNGTAAAIIPAANELKNTTTPLTKTLKQLPSLATAADPTLETAEQVAPALKRLGEDATAPVQALEPTAKEVSTIASGAGPILSEENSRAMSDLLWFVENWSLATQARDGLGHFVGADLEIDPSIITSALESYLGQDNQTISLKKSKPAPATTKKTPATNLAGVVTTAGNTASTVVNKVSTVVNKVSSTVQGVVNGVGSTVNKTVGNLTGAVGGLVHNLGHAGSKNSKSSTNTTTTSASTLKSLLGYLLGS